MATQLTLGDVLSRLGPPVAGSERVEAYYNLHQHCLSYRSHGGRIQHADLIALRNVRFAVQPAGRERVRREGRKNVHAYLRGVLTHVEPRDTPLPLTAADLMRAGAQRITYNPYRHDTFVYADSDTPIHAADTVIALSDKTVWRLS